MDLLSEHGKVILIDKAYQWSSFDVVRKIRNTLKIKKIGHAGTLDPLATGLLVLCTDKMTKSISKFQDYEKEYHGEMVLGKTTPSFDSETEVDHEFDISHITESRIKGCIIKFLGTQYQIPPDFSAIKVEGRRVYKSARKGVKTGIEAREIFIKEFQITEINIPSVKFQLVCSKGTYVRSLVRDFGLAVGAGAYMSALRRTRIGEFDVKNASQVEDYLNNFKQQNESLQTPGGV